MKEDADPRSGMILVLVLWTIALVAGLAMAASASFRGFAGIMALDADRTKADGLLNAGLETAGGIVAKLGDRPLSARQMTLPFESGTLFIRMSDEGGKIDINKGAVPLLSAALLAAGAENPRMVAQAIDRWRQADGMGQPGDATANAEPAPQQPTQAAQTTVQPAQPVQDPNQTTAGADDSKKDDGFRSFTDLRQLVQIPGMTRAVVERLMPLATIYGDEKVNLLTASPDVLAILPGLGEAQASVLINARGNATPDKNRLEQLAGAAKDYVKADGRPVVSVEMGVSLKDGYRASAKAIIVVLPDDRQPYRVLSWVPLHIAEHRITPRS